MSDKAEIAAVESQQWLPTLLVVTACICFGSSPFFARSLTDAGIPAYAVAFFRYALSAAILLPLLLFTRLPRAAVAWGIASGIAMGFGWIGFVQALKTVPVSTIGVLYMTYPVFTLLIGWAAFRDLPSMRALTGTALVLLAAILSASPAAVDPRHLPAR